MLKYILKRLVYGFLTFLIIMTLTFFLMHSIPGGPFDGDSLTKLPPEVQANLMEKFGLDKPLGEQYLVYMNNLFHGELGVSISYSPRTVKSIIVSEIPVTATLAFTSVSVTIVIGVLYGIVAALKQGKWQDQVAKVITTLGITIPSFVMCTLLIYVFAVKLRVLPTMGFDGPKNLILPATALSFGSIATLSRLTRSSLLDVVRQDYIRTAKAKGLKNSVVIFKHALKNSLLPVVTYLGPLVTALLTGSFVVEKIFAIPGIGREMVSAIGDRDYTMILGLTAIFSIIMITSYLVVDIMYALIDPRVKLDS
ncbi:MAG: ABC transporter permease [Lachnospiraceae bacterium]|nr:ABC transporter permease [Lachnospiraceae bacterium]